MTVMQYTQDNMRTQDKHVTHSAQHSYNTVLHNIHFNYHLFRYTERHNTLEGNKQTSGIIGHAALLE